MSVTCMISTSVFKVFLYIGISHIVNIAQSRNTRKVFLDRHVIKMCIRASLMILFLYLDETHVWRKYKILILISMMGLFNDFPAHPPNPRKLAPHEYK